MNSYSRVPFEKKDPKAIEVIQVVLESIRASRLIAVVGARLTRP